MAPHLAVRSDGERGSGIAARFAPLPETACTCARAQTHMLDGLTFRGALDLSEKDLGEAGESETQRRACISSRPFCSASSGGAPPAGVQGEDRARMRTTSSRVASPSGRGPRLGGAPFSSASPGQSPTEPSVARPAAARRSYGAPLGPPTVFLPPRRGCGEPCAVLQERSPSLCGCFCSHTALLETGLEPPLMDSFADVWWLPCPCPRVPLCCLCPLS